MGSRGNLYMVTFIHHPPPQIKNNIMFIFEESFIVLFCLNIESFSLVLQFVYNGGYHDGGAVHS
jgi:hypothetical protein